MGGGNSFVKSTKRIRKIDLVDFVIQFSYIFNSVKGLNSLCSHENSV